MAKTNLAEPWHSASECGPCACSQLRRTARKLSSLYDGVLGTAGLTVTQHALLVNIARAEKVSRTALAERLGMDRTTLTRNLQPLEKAKLVVTGASADRRERLLTLSVEGRRKLRQSYALWERAQQSFAAQIGPGMLERFRASLQAAEAAAEAVLSEER